MQAAPRPRRRGFRILLLVAALIVLVPVAGLALFAATFDPDSAKGRIEAAVKAATGRDLVLGGRLGLKLSLWPTVEARDVVFANVAGGSRPQMARLERIEAQVALLPLLLRREVEIDRLLLVHPDILVETDAAGRPNWRFAPSVPTRTLPDVAAAPSPASRPFSLAVREVRIEDGTLTWRDGRSGKVATVALGRFMATAPRADSPVAFSLAASSGGAPFSASGEIGDVRRLRDPLARDPWPLRLVVEGAGARLAVDGVVSQPAEARGYRLKLDGAAPDLAALDTFFPHANLPSLRDVTVAGTLSDTGGTVPEMEGLTIRAVSGGVPFTIGGSLGGGVPVPIDLAASAAQASVTAKGSIADLRRLAGVDLALAGRAADLSMLGPLLHWTLPALRDVAFEGRLADGGNGLAAVATLQGASLRSSAGDLAGDLALDRAGPPSLRATLSGQRIDLDTLLAASGAPAPAASPSDPAPAGQPPPATPPAGGPVQNGGRVFSDRSLPFPLLRAVDADLRVSLAALRSGGTEYRDVAGHLVLAGGRLNIDPFGLRPAAGRLDARLSVDATQAAPPVALFVRGAGLDVATLLALARMPPDARGAIDVDADLRAEGASLHALAATLDGHLGLAMVDGTVENRIVSGSLGQVLQHARLPDITARPGSLPVRCVAIRFDAHAGTAELRTLLVDTALFRLEGGGTLDLGEETMALRLRPLARLGGTGLIVPLRLAGPFRAPRIDVDAGGRASAPPGGGSQPLGLIIGALGGDGMIKGGAGGDCAPALEAARGGIAGPLPAPMAEQAKLPKPADLLRQFLR